MRLADARLATAPPPVALCLADLVQGAWRRVAVRERCRDEDVWTWDLEEIEALVLAREAGRVTTAQQRQPDGAMWLLAQVA